MLGGGREPNEILCCRSFRRNRPVSSFFLLYVLAGLIFLRFGSFLEEWFSFDENNNVSWHQGKMMIRRLLGLACWVAGFEKVEHGEASENTTHGSNGTVA
jgi:hypothetical protein